MVYRKTRAAGAADDGAGVTARDIARAVGVSATVVSSILSGREVVRVSEATRQRVRDAAREMGYRRNTLAASLRTGRTRTIGIVSPLIWQGVSDGLRQSYLTGLLAALSVASARVDRNAMTLLGNGLAEMPVASVVDGRVEGVILFGMPMDLPGADEWIRELQATGIPCAEIGSCYGRYQVHADNAGGARQAVQHLIARGHSRIGYGGLSSGMYSARMREAGFRAAVQEAGLSPDETPVLQSITAIREHLRLPEGQRPTALFCGNDTLALKARDAIGELGLRIPEDVALIGFDNSSDAEAMRPRLTSVDNPLNAMAEAAVSLVQAQRENEEITNPTVLVETRLIVRDSAGAPLSPSARGIGANGTS